MRSPQMIGYLDICQGSRNRLPYYVDSTHEADDSTEQRNDYLQLVVGGLWTWDNILYVANNTRKTYIEHIFLSS